MLRELPTFRDCAFTRRSAAELQALAPTLQVAAMILTEKGPLADYLRAGSKRPTTKGVALKGAVLAPTSPTRTCS